MKKLKINLLAILILLSLVFLVDKTQAVNDKFSEKIEDRKAKVEEKKTEMLCGRLDNIISRLEKNIDSDRIRFEERISERVREMNQNREGRDNELEERRIMRDESREKFYQDLEVKAGDNSDKIDAVKEFKNSVEIAVETRRTAIDSARDAMNNGINQAIEDRNNNMENLRNEFKNAIQKSINDAKNNCNEDVTSDEVKNIISELRENVKKDRDNFKNEINESKKVQETIQVLRENRKNSVKLAIDNFKSSMKAAQEKLRLAMGAQVEN